MRRVRFIRVAVAALGATALLSALAAQPTPSTTAPTGDARSASAWVPPNPTNAGKIFRWGNKQWGDEFKAPLSSMWRASRPSMVRNQHGMLTLDAPETSVNVIATVLGHNRRYGRWEARVRGRQYGAANTPYTVVWELVPRTGAYNCGARSLILGQYTLGTNLVSTHARNLPDLDFTATKRTYLRENEFHTYAVEITSDHISWFVDTKVIRTERRPEAMRAADYAVRFRLQGVPGARMNKGRMQMDWVRYYTLARPNAQSIEAPQLDRTTYADAC